jgi:hypothetical protein
MIKEAIDRIINLAGETMIEDPKQRTWTRDRFHLMRNPSVEPIKIHTLTGLVDWIGTIDVEDKGLDNPKNHVGFIQVVDHETVRFVGFLDKKYNSREVYVNCNLLPFSAFPFGCEMEIEKFIVCLRSRFIDDEGMRRVLKVVSGISQSRVVQANDDGVSQSVIAKDEIFRDTKIDFDGKCTLRPYRTFPEAAQPESNFYLRFTQREKGLPLVTLYESDGGAWRNGAILNIKEWLEANQHVVAIVG